MRRLAVIIAAALASSLLVAMPAEANQARLRAAIDRLPVAAETNAGYARTKFRHWVDANGDCQDTRAEVLVQESKVTARGCTVRKGKWFSYYDRKTWRRASDVDVDHLVPLKEAWGSGAKRWNAATRERFANDLADRRALVAVTDNVNQSKGDRDPRDWMPKYGKCRYVREWTATKLRWKLTVNRAEKRKLRTVASGCANTKLVWKPAKVTRTSTATGSTTAKGVRFVFVVYDPTGPDDGSNLNAERVKIKNTSGKKKNLTGWKLLDAAGNRYRFPSFALPAGSSVVVHSGKGANRPRHLYAGWGYTWNNTGDTARLRTKAGVLADRCSWGDGSGTKYC